MRAIRKRLPAFIKALDYRLLINKPTIWETQIHTMAFLFAVATGISLLASLLLPLSITQVNGGAIILLSVSMGVISLVLLGFWIWSQVTQQVEAYHGKYTTADAKRRFGYYAAVLFLSALPVLLPPIVYDARTAALVGDDAFASDMKRLNQGQVYFPLKYLPSLNIYELMNSESDVMNKTPFVFNSSKQHSEAVSPYHDDKREDFEEKYQEYLNSPEALSQIEAYLAISKKYLGGALAVASVVADDEAVLAAGPLTATDVLALFKDRQSSFESTKYYQLQENIEKIAYAKREGIHLSVFESGSIFGVLLVLLLLTNAAIVARYVGFKYFVAAIISMPLLGGFFAMLLGSATVGLLVLIAVAIIGRSYFYNKLRGRSIFGKSAKRSSLWVGLGQLFLFPITLGVLYIGTGYYCNVVLGLGIDTILWAMSLELVLIALLFVYGLLPTFHRTYLRLNASPEVQ